MKRLASIILFISLYCICMALNSHVPVLERRININMQSQSIEQVLTEIAHQADFAFSYNPEAIGAAQSTSINIENQTVRYALNLLFADEVSYRERGKFLILQQAKKPKKNTPSVVEGYLYNDMGEILADATVYSPGSVTAVNTDEFGYFRIEIDAKDTIGPVLASKKGYHDAMLMPLPGRSEFVQLQLPPHNEQLAAIDSNGTPAVYPSFLINRNMKVAAENIGQSLQRTVQFSLAPHIGTNSLLSGTTSNMFSFNLIGGYTESVTVLELGAFMNIVRYDAGVVQGAGFSNYVGRNSKGIQGAGFANHVGGNFNGVQGAGFMNNVAQNASGLQSAGFSNTTRQNFKGLQAAGFANHTGGNMHGLQAAGFGNNTGGNITGVQAAGFSNRTGKSVNGVQAAGALNAGKKIEGAQLAGIINIADTLNGAQIAGIINIAGTLNGFQLGLINIADTCTGVPLGLFSFVAKGYNRFEVYTGETFHANVAYRGGVRKLHNIIMAGVQLNNTDNTPLYTFGLGMGSNLGKGPRISYDLDLTFRQVAYGSHFSNINMLYSAGFGVEWKTTKSTALFAGLSYNLYLTDASSVYFDNIFSNIPPYTISNERFDENNALMSWIGFKAGIRLF